MNQALRRFLSQKGKSGENKLRQHPFLSFPAEKIFRQQFVNEMNYPLLPAQVCRSVDIHSKENGYGTGEWFEE